MMTKSGFDRMAAALRSARYYHVDDEESFDRMVEDYICPALKEENPRFDKVKFMNAVQKTP